MPRPIFLRTPMRHVVLDALDNHRIHYDRDRDVYEGQGGVPLTPLADKALTLFLEHGMVGVMPSGTCTLMPSGVDMLSTWPLHPPHDVKWYEESKGEHS